MTADDKQSIYGRGFSWKRVSDELRLQGRTTVLRTNYRSTRELLAATRSGTEEAAEQTSAVHQGPRPIVMACRGSQAKQIAVLFERWAEELRVPVWCSAVLVREGVLGKALVSQLKSEGLPARWVESKELKLDEPIVKVMTIHAAKGLEFPMIALAEASEDSIPWTGYQPQDPEDEQEFLNQERNLFHVALTRAMRRLAVCCPAERPFRFVVELNSDLWDWRQDDQAVSA